MISSNRKVSSLLRSVLKWYLGKWPKCGSPWLSVFQSSLLDLAAWSCAVVFFGGFFSVFCLFHFCLFAFKEAKLIFYFLKISELWSSFSPFTWAGGRLNSAYGQVALSEAPSVVLPALASVLVDPEVGFVYRAHGCSSIMCIQNNPTATPTNPDSSLMLTPTALSYMLNSCGCLSNPAQVGEFCLHELGICFDRCRHCRYCFLSSFLLFNPYL